MPENLLCMQLSHIRYANMDFFKTPHIQIQLLGKDPVFKYEFLVLFIYPWSKVCDNHESNKGGAASDSSDQIWSSVPRG